MKKWALVFIVSMLTACISPPQGLETDEFTLSSLKKIQAEDYACQCKKVRLGGKVLSAYALKNKTKIEILSLPVLKYSAKPVMDGYSDGRFVAYIEGFVDPERLKAQYITVVGVLKEQARGKIDQADYVYPVVDVKHYKQWRLVQEYYYDPEDWADYRAARRAGWGIWFPQPQLRYNLY